MGIAKRAWLVPAIVLVFVVAACGPAQTATPVPTKAASEAAKPTAPSGAPVQATPSKPAAEAKPPVKIGLIESMTGAMAQLGKDNQDGFDLYMEEIGWTVAGRKIERLVEDDEFKADVGMTKLRKLVESDKVNLIAGLHSSALCNAIAPYVRDNKVITVISGNCGAQSLTMDPAMRSPYLWRTTQATAMLTAPLAEWVIQNGHKKVVLVAADFAGAIEPASQFAWAFIGAGGTIVQEMYPAVGTTDFGPFLAQINPGTDAVVAAEYGADGLRFATQYTEYGWKAKKPLFDLMGAMASGPNMVELKDAGVGIIGAGIFTTDGDSAELKQFLQAFRAKYPGRTVSRDVAAGYAGAQVIAAAIKGADGNVEDKDKLLAALKKVEVRTPKGPLKFDDLQMTIQDIYVYAIDKAGNEYKEKKLGVMPSVGQFWKFKPEELLKFPATELKGKWTNIDKGQMQAMLKPYVQ